MPEVPEIPEECVFLNGNPRNSTGKNGTESGNPSETDKKLTFFGDSFVLKFCDCLLVSTVVQVNVVGFWRGLFGLFSFFHEFSHLALIYLFGGMLQFQFTVWHKTYGKYLREKNRNHSILRKLYAYINSSSEVLRWIGLWSILDESSGLDIQFPVTFSIICYIILVLFKFSNTLLAPPCAVVPDPPADELFEFGTPFRTSITKKKNAELPLYLLDCFFSVFVIGSLVVFIWRGVWCLTDVFLFPENEKYSALSSLAIGYVIVIIIFSFQNLMERVSEKLTGFWRLFVADIYVFISFIGTINLWRGMWNLLNLYFLPEFPIWSYWITHLGCFGFLVLIKCSNTILVRGVYMDGEDGGQCIAFPTFYFSLFFEKHKVKEQKTGNEKRNSQDQNAESDGRKSEQVTNDGKDDSMCVNDSV